MSPAQPSPHRKYQLPEAGLQHRAIDFAFRSYKSLVSPVIHAVAPSRCLYLPTCSEYAYTALLRFGIMRGTWLALRRLTRCHPWGKGGLDPLPPPKLTPATGQTSANHLP
jgi:putative membrane protein insertion efficiency factor